MKCNQCLFLAVNLSEKNNYQPVKYRYPTCFCRCSILGKPLNLLTEEDKKNCFFLNINKDKKSWNL